MNNNDTKSPDQVDTPDGDTPLSLAEYKDIIDEIDAQPRNWRKTADGEMDYADGNQLKTELLEAHGDWLPEWARVPVRKAG